MARVVVIGYGNPLRGDDGLGWVVARHLMNRRLARRVEARHTDDGVEVLALYQLTPELAEEISRSELAIFTDACCDRAPGHLSCEVIAPRSGHSQATTHHLDPPGLLAFTQELYGTCPQMAILLTVGGESFGYGEGLSSIVAATVPLLEHVLDSFIHNFAPTYPSDELDTA